MTMPTETDLKIAQALADVRSDIGDRFNRVEHRFGEVDARLSAIERELQITRKLWNWLLGGVFGAVGTMILGSATIAWSASAVVAEVKQLAARADATDRKLDTIDRKLDAVLGRAGKPGG